MSNRCRKPVYSRGCWRRNWNRYSTSGAPVPVNNTTLAQFFHHYIEHHAKVHTRITGDCLKHYRLYLAPWSDRLLTDIKKRDIAELQTQMIADGKSEDAANRAVVLLCMLYNKAIEWEMFDGPNPAAGVRKFTLQSRDRFLQSDELPRFIAAVKRLRHQTSQDYYLMLLFTAQRRTNTAEMRWQDIDFSRAVWHIDRTKNGTSHNVPLPTQAMEILVRRRSADDKHTTWVFPKRDGSGPAAWLQDAWNSILKNAGIENLRVHDLRRTHASWQAITGVGTPIIGATLNHKDPKSTMIYARLSLDPVRGAMQQAVDTMCSR